MAENDSLNHHPDLRAHVELSDQALVQLLIEGSQDAMSEIFNRYYRMVMRVALYVVRDTGEAQDVVQNVFLEFYQKAKLFDPGKGSLKTWLLQYSYGRAINRKRSLQLRSFYNQTSLDALDAIRPNATDKVMELESPEAARLVEQVLGVLSDRQRAVIEMVAFRGMTLSETAQALSESHGNVQHLYYRSIEKLRKFLRNAGKNACDKKESKYTFSFLPRFGRSSNEAKKGEVEIVKARAI